jgi:pimeloyl-ACP methyl ester carboxylesterase
MRGGYIAWEFWQRHGLRLGGLILCDTRAAADDPTIARGRLQSAARVLAEGPEFLAKTMGEKLFAAATRRHGSVSNLWER